MKAAIYILFGALLKVCEGQYIAINPRPSQTNPCENMSNTAHIEHFFNIIFTEFHNTPPACVCIQMCPEQPTYCYPNGCLKRPERRRVEEPVQTTPAPIVVSKVQHESQTKSAMFVIDNHKDLMDDLLEGPGLNNYLDRVESQNFSDLIFRPNPFKEMVLRYKKPPKLEMKYNLREQVKNTKSGKLNKDKIDISKTRWPSNKHLLHGKQPFNRIRHYKKNEDPRQTKFFVSMFPEYSPANYTPIFYKKYLSKRENNDGMNVEAVYLYKTDNANFSLETLIDNLIENSLDKSRKDSRLNFSLEMDDSYRNLSRTDENFTEINLLQEYPTFRNNINNTSVNIVSMNSTNENIDVNKYLHDLDMTNKTNFLDMIASMSKEIEKQNAASLEMMGRVAGRNVIENDMKTLNDDDKSLYDTTTVANINVTDNIMGRVSGRNVMKYHTESLNNVNNSLPDTTTLANTFIAENITLAVNATSRTLVELVSTTKTSIYKKTKQRIVRKLKHGKLN